MRCLLHGIARFSKQRRIGKGQSYGMASLLQNLYDHLRLTNASDQKIGETQDLKHAPLFSSHVARHNGRAPVPQYGLLGIETFHHVRGLPVSANRVERDKLIYGNHTEPWSAFICGSQGSGKSHTLATLLENSILNPPPAGELPHPLTAMAFHWDEFTGPTTTQFCELAYFCSKGTQVQVLVSPANYTTMKRLYEKLPGLKDGSAHPKVHPLQFHESQLDSECMMTLMSVDEEKSTPLYLQVISKMLQDQAMNRDGAPGIDYKLFRKQCADYDFTDSQRAMLNMRLQLLDVFVDSTAGKTKDHTWSSDPGTLTIVDLSSAFVKPGDACALFNICLKFFMAARGKSGRVVILDEAHKFLTATGEAEKLVSKLEAIVCQQRHLGTRIFVATQEPTLDPRLLDLCTVKIIHRFDSKAWYQVLRQHFAGTGPGGDDDVVFNQIIGLPTGHALLFASTAMLHVEGGEVEEHGGPQDETTRDAASRTGHVVRLRNGYVGIRIRQRATYDGGKSIGADDVHNNPHLDTSKSKSPPKPKDPESTLKSKADGGNSSSSGGAGAALVGAKRNGAPEPVASNAEAPRILDTACRAVMSILGINCHQTQVREAFLLIVGQRIVDSRARNASPASMDFGIVRRKVEQHLDLATGVLDMDTKKSRKCINDLTRDCIVSSSYLTIIQPEHTDVRTGLPRRPRHCQHHRQLYFRLKHYRYKLKASTNSTDVSSDIFQSSNQSCNAAMGAQAMQ